MLPLGKILWAALTWLTAFTTVFAGMSPCQCVCPDGHRKLFCLGIACGPCACCCAGACCGDTPSAGDRSDSDGLAVKSAKRRCCCCCQNCSTRGTDSDSRQDHINNQGCKRSLSGAKIVADPVRVPAVADCSASLPLAEIPAPVLPGVLMCSAWFVRASYHPPPPTDLVIVLQHFVI